MNHPFLDHLDSSIRAVAGADPVEFHGAWEASLRRVYRSEEQVGAGCGPFVDAEDWRWRGTLTAAESITGIAFLVAAGDLHWVKAPDTSPSLSVGVSLSAYAEYTDRNATFTASLGGSYLPGVPVPAPAVLREGCTLGPGVVTTGRVTCLARTSSAAFLVLLMPRTLLKMGRHRLWRVRDEIASSLPVGTRDLLTRRRRGVIRRGETPDPRGT